MLGHPSCNLTRQVKKNQITCLSYWKFSFHAISCSGTAISAIVVTLQHISGMFLIFKLHETVLLP